MFLLHFHISVCSTVVFSFPSLLPASASYKESFASCLTLIFESARHDAGASDLTTVLEEAGWSADFISQFNTLFAQNKEAIRTGSSTSSPPLPSLSSLSSTSAPSIIDVSWRVDDYLRSDSIDAVRLPSYLLALTTTSNDANNNNNQVKFACNFQQLQDLLAKLKDAQKQIQQRVE